MTIRSPARIRVAMDDINEGENLDETDTNASVHSGSAHAFSGSDGTRMATATSHYSIHTPCASPVRSEHGFFSSPASAQELTTQEPLTPEDTTREAWDERLRGAYERSPYCEQGPGQWGKLLETELDKKTKSASHFAGMYDIDRPSKEKHELEDQITKKMDAQREFLQDFAFFLAASEVCGGHRDRKSRQSAFGKPSELKTSRYRCWLWNCSAVRASDPSKRSRRAWLSRKLRW
eukprot:GEMP01064235.1.p1 GENE.GEMP01064235.1~~GEMP01064235.1.p1  ORF type:complete len:234 (+),score=60.30 GEMP01064235.1:117-818(+)